MDVELILSLSPLGRVPTTLALTPTQSSLTAFATHMRGSLRAFLLFSCQLCEPQHEEPSAQLGTRVTRINGEDIIIIIRDGAYRSWRNDDGADIVRAMARKGKRNDAREKNKKRKQRKEVPPAKGLADNTHAERYRRT